MGYAWNPSVSYVKVGDEVNFRWATPIEVNGLPIEVFSTADATEKTYSNDGFRFPKGLSGTHK